jgi:hypothetical protein
MNIRSVLRTLGAVALVTSIAPVSAQEVTFTFGWKPGLQVQVDHRVLTDEGGNPKESAVRYTLSVDEVGENLAVKFLNPRIGGPKLAPNAGLQAFQEQISVAAFPELRINRSGEYLGLFDPAAQTTRVLTLLQKIVKEKVPGPGQIGVNNAILGYASPAFLASKAADLWTPIVGFWSGGSLAVGQTHEFEADVPVPLMPGMVVRQKGQITLVETHSCLRSGAERTCAGIQLRAETDPDDAARVIQQMMERLNNSRRSLTKVDRFASKSELVLVTEPDGMFPHEYSLRREMRLTMTINGRTEESPRVDTHEVRYSY